MKKLFASWFFSKTSKKDLKTEITPDMLNEDVEHVIDCIVDSIVGVGIIRKPTPVVPHAITGRNLVITSEGNYSALQPAFLLFEIAQGINSHLHRANKIGATDEGQMILVLLDDDMQDILKVVYRSINEIFKGIKKSDTHLVAKQKFERGLNNYMREELRKYFAENERVPSALTHYKAVNFVESVNINPNEIKNILSRSLKKGHSDTFSEIYNDKPADVPLVAKASDKEEVPKSSEEKMSEYFGAVKDEWANRQSGSGK